jgi:glycosyltransferase involved in cell wall biosynthesis
MRQSGAVWTSPAQAVQTPNPDRPSVSCLIPTYNRREFVPRAIDCFLNQDYANRELIVIDDGTDPIEDVLLHDPRLRWVRLESRQTIGAKRNAGADAAAGQLLANSDEDDRCAPWRLSYQVERLQSAAVDRPLRSGSTALNRSLPPTGVAVPTRPVLRKWLADRTLLFTRKL